jgi:hypothetical protein
MSNTTLKIKTWKIIKSTAFFMFEALSAQICTILSNLMVLMYSINALHMQWASFHSFAMSMEPMNTSPFGQANITFNNGCHVMLSQPLKQMVAPCL